MCPNCSSDSFVEKKAVEVGNIFPLGTWYAERMRVYFTDKDGGKKPVLFASYGIGPTRVMGTLVEVGHDERGIIWPKSVAPFDVHLVELPGAKNAKKMYDELTSKGIDVLWDDREVPAGEKFADADLIGVPVRLVVSVRNGDKIEWVFRYSDGTKFYNTFFYDRNMGTWQWDMDGEEKGKLKPFARVKLTRN